MKIFVFIKEELDRRKKLIEQYDQQRKQNAPLEDIDQEAKEEAEYMLKRANDLRQEQEDEVKRLNEVGFNIFLLLFQLKVTFFSLVNSQCKMSCDT